MKLEIDSRSLLIVLFLVVLAMILPGLYVKPPRTTKPEPKPETHKSTQPKADPRLHRQEAANARHEAAKEKFMQESNARMRERLSGVDYSPFKSSIADYPPFGSTRRPEAQKEIILNVKK